jgi:hypothetical protein
MGTLVTLCEGTGLARNSSWYLNEKDSESERNSVWSKSRASRLDKRHCRDFLGGGIDWERLTACEAHCVSLGCKPR